MVPSVCTIVLLSVVCTLYYSIKFGIGSATIGWTVFWVYIGSRWFNLDQSVIIERRQHSSLLSDLNLPLDRR